MYVLPLTLVAISTMIAKKASGSWFSPASFFGLMWFLFLTGPILFAPEFNYDIKGIFFISIIVMACTSGALIAILGYDIKKNQIMTQDSISYNPLTNYLIFFLFISTIGLIGLISFTKSNYLIDGGVFFWYNIPNLVSIDRYDDQINYPMWIKYSLYFIYTSNIISGIILSKTTAKPSSSTFQPIK